MKGRHIVCIALYLASLPGTASNILAAPDSYPLEYWALREVISNVQVSPDGKYLGLMKIPSRDGNPIIEVYETVDLSREPFRLNADPMEITDFYWVSDNAIVFTLRQKVRDQIEGFNEGVYENKLAMANVEDEDMRSFDEVNATIDNLLPNEPDKVILSFNEGGEEGPESKIREAFRPRSYWQLDLESGAKSLLIRGKVALGNIDFDGKGNPWLARGFDLAEGDLLWYVRKPGTADWQEIHRLSENSFESFEVEGFDESDRSILFVTANNGHDKQGLWEFHADSRSFGELIYRRPDVDVLGVRMHSNSWTHPDTVAAVTYATDKLHYEYFDGVEEATYEQLESLIPFAHYVRITSRSRDGKTMTIANSGPRDPGSFYLLKDGQLAARNRCLNRNSSRTSDTSPTKRAMDGRFLPS